MNITGLIGQKIAQTQGFLEDGTRVPLSIIAVGGNVVSQVKTPEKEGYSSIQLSFGENMRPDKPTSGHIKKAGLSTTPRFFREIRVDDVAGATAGSPVVIDEVFEAGDYVDVTGTSKGKGFAGVVKRYRFAGGPRTHGQSDRERARGSSGSGTTPGRVYKGKKMAGRMGNEQVTVKNLEVLEIKDDLILVKGLIPGTRGSIVVLNKVGRKNKNFTPLWAEKKEEEKIETVQEDLSQIAEVADLGKEEVKTEETAEVVETAPAADVVEAPTDATPATATEVVNEAEKSADAESSGETKTDSTEGSVESKEEENAGK